MFDIGSRIIYLRKLHNLSANKLAKELKIDPSTINKVEKGTAKPSIDLLFNICGYFGITLSEFFSDTQEQEPLPPDIRRLLGLAHRLTPRQREILLAAAEEWAELNPD